MGTLQNISIGDGKVSAAVLTMSAKGDLLDYQAGLVCYGIFFDDIKGKMQRVCLDAGALTDTQANFKNFRITVCRALVAHGFQDAVSQRCLMHGVSRKDSFGFGKNFIKQRESLHAGLGVEALNGVAGVNENIITDFSRFGQQHKTDPSLCTLNIDRCHQIIDRDYS